jgi:hypothetical protein
MIRTLLPLALAGTLSTSGVAIRAQDDVPGASPTVTVRQSGEADVVGNDDRALEEALRRLRPAGGTLVIGPGRYVIRRALFLPYDLVLRGEEGAILALPAPARLAEAALVGTRTLVLDREHELAADSRVQLVPPDGTAAPSRSPSRCRSSSRRERASATRTS